MAGKHRNVQPGMLNHPAYRRADLLAREVWLGLILMADDEGRLHDDTALILETIFPRQFDFTPEAIDEALRYWSEEGFLLRYRAEGVQVLFLTGWFEHQTCDKRWRVPSSLPAPPCVVNSWKAADAVCEWAKHEAHRERAPRSSALREFAALKPREQKRVLREIHACNTRGTREQHAVVEGVESVESVDVERGTRGRARPAPRDSQLPNTPLANAVAAYLGNGPDTVRWHNDLTRQLALPANTVTADQVIAALNSNTAGPVGPETTFADRFIARLARENADANALSQSEAEAVAAQERFILAQRKLLQDAMIAQAEAKQ